MKLTKEKFDQHAAWLTNGVKATYLAHGLLTPHAYILFPCKKPVAHRVGYHQLVIAFGDFDVKDDTPVIRDAFTDAAREGAMLLAWASPTKIKNEDPEAMKEHGEGFTMYPCAPGAPSCKHFHDGLVIEVAADGHRAWSVWEANPRNKDLLPIEGIDLEKSAVFRNLAWGESVDCPDPAGPDVDTPPPCQ